MESPPRLSVAAPPSPALTTSSSVDDGDVFGQFVRENQGWLESRFSDFWREYLYLQSADAEDGLTFISFVLSVEMFGRDYFVKFPQLAGRYCHLLLPMQALATCSNWRDEQLCIAMF